MYSHKLHHWPGLEDSKVGMISDSIMKWIMNVVHLDNQAVPGLTLSTGLEKMKSGFLNIHGFDCLIIHIGSNDFENGYTEKLLPRETTAKILGKILAIFLYLRESVPTTKLAFSMILPRPKDTPNMVADLDNVNTAIKELCKTQKVVYINSAKSVTIGTAADKSLYAYDLLHLNYNGVAAMKRYLKGSVGALLSKTKPAK
jgi:lysophospholipase L1-like esterase